MPQFYSRAWNVRGPMLLMGVPLYLLAAGWLLAQWVHAPRVTGVNVAVEQPIPFSHEFHAGRLAIDCRYCHTTVEQSAFAGLPATATCMGCHEHVWTGLAAVEPLSTSYETRVPIAWRRVHNLPDFAYFDHGVHVASGVACVTCHGRVDRMPQVWKTETLAMQWCLDCHRAPERFIRPREYVFAMDWSFPTNRAQRRQLAEQLALPHVPTSSDELGAMLVQKYDIQRYTSCSNCHQ